MIQDNKKEYPCLLSMFPIQNQADKAIITKYVSTNDPHFIRDLREFNTYIYREREPGAKTPTIRMFPERMFPYHAFMLNY